MKFRSSIEAFGILVSMKQKGDLPSLYKGRYWESVDSDRIQCNLCPRRCQIKEGSRGFCFVRRNVGNTLILATYGRSSGFCIDPIEKKPLNHFYPGSAVLSFGTAGCNLGCQFCQNWDISKAKAWDSLQDEASPEKIARVAHQLGCSSVAFTYNDPTIFAEYAIDIAHACHEKDVYAVAVTAGYMCEEPRADFYSVMDAANVDLKGFTQAFYKTVCMSELAPVLDTLRYLKDETDVWFEITNLIIPDTNDDFKQLDAMTDWIMAHLGPDVPVHFTAFHPDFRMRTLPPTSKDKLREAKHIAESKGIRFVYLGNIHDSTNSSTYCPTCSNQLIERDWYELGVYHISEGNCRFCGTTIPGHFSNAPGKWGRKRLPIFMSEFND